jgi:undecaprenyl phosphate N,N'-diacetylbacillosamine 1-phosphate transferase
MRIYKRYLKRGGDFTVAFVALVCLLPVLFILTLLLLIANRGKPFFIQARPGKGGKVFHILKFKTMNDKTDSQGKLLPDEKRLTRVGKLLRKTSLDELLQLFNVLKGDMSLVGPRPLLVEYLACYTAQQARRHEVRPGITGWAQINGRNTLSWEKKFELDVWYVDHLSLKLDLQIIWKTFLKVFKSEGVVSQTSATMEKFTGSI